MEDIYSKVSSIKKYVLDEIKNATSESDLRHIKESELSKKSELLSLMRYFKDLTPEEKIKFGKALNDAKEEIVSKLDEKTKIFLEEAYQKKLKELSVDITLPEHNYQVGHINPLLLIQDEILDIFVKMGYEVYEGPDIESDYYNFERMNIPSNHPSRDMQDSFYFDASTLLRTHTSPAQARMMDEKKGEDIKVVCPGKCFRRDDDDATHSHQFMQIEGLVVGKGISLGDLKGTLETFVKKLFGEKHQIRLRSSYFPFTEPSVEVDVSCTSCLGKGCSICKNTGFIEILGAGMVHPNVLKMSGYDPKIYTGFAFGVGIDRVAMLKYDIKDIRDLYINDIRFIKAFTKVRN